MKIKSDYSNLPQWKEVNVKSSLPKELDCLNELAHNLWWAWNYEARNLFKSLDEKLYEEVLNDAEQTNPTVHPKIKVAAPGAPQLRPQGSDRQGQGADAQGPQRL